MVCSPRPTWAGPTPVCPIPPAGFSWNACRWSARRTGAWWSSPTALITRLPNGYDTPLGPGGQGLSAGQAQRIALARALFGNPTVVIMDEPNAFLDAEGELTLANALAKLKERKVTILIVAHRTNILADADKLLIMRDGRLEMMGPREEVSQRLAANRAPPTVKAEPSPAALGA